MRLARRKDFTIGEWIGMSVVIGTAVLFAGLTTLNKKWVDAIVYTILLFTVLIVVLRPAWGRAAFWKNPFPIFALHVIAVIVVVQAIPPEWRGIPGFLQLAAGAVEGLLILAVIWRRTVRPKHE